MNSKTESLTRLERCALRILIDIGLNSKSRPKGKGFLKQARSARRKLGFR